MKLLFSPQAKILNYFSHTIYNDVNLVNNDKQIFYTDVIKITNEVVNFQGHATFFF